MISQNPENRRLYDILGASVKSMLSRRLPVSALVFHRPLLHKPLSFHELSQLANRSCLFRQRVVSRMIGLQRLHAVKNGRSRALSTNSSDPGDRSQYATRHRRWDLAWLRGRWLHGLRLSVREAVDKWANICPCSPTCRHLVSVSHAYAAGSNARRTSPRLTRDRCDWQTRSTWSDQAPDFTATRRRSSLETHRTLSPGDAQALYPQRHAVFSFSLSQTAPNQRQTNYNTTLQRYLIERLHG